MTAADDLPRRPLSGLRLGELVDEMRERLTEIGSTRDKMQRPPDAVLAVGAGLELDSTLQRIVQVAVEPVGAAVESGGTLSVRTDSGGTRLTWQVPISG